LRMNTLYEGVEIHYNPPLEDALVMGDVFVKDIVYNLLSNACKYGGSGPVEIEMYQHLDDSYEYWRLDVKDQGEGVPEERRAFLFKRFDKFNVESASAERGHYASGADRRKGLGGRQGEAGPGQGVGVQRHLPEG
jgi:K+-sensing histidine kinase KdpD